MGEQLTHVVAGTKRRAVGSDDDRAHTVVGRDGRERVAQRREQIFGQAVAGLRAVEREHRDGPDVLAQQDRVRRSHMCGSLHHQSI